MNSSNTVTPATSQPSGGAAAVGVPREPLGQLFLRFLRFGGLAWGGPVAQIAMLRQELVVEDRWVTSEHFNRVLALYQVLPGPEAHEMCVYFGMLSRGRIGGFLAGLAFMLPGFVLMFLLSWLYVRYGIATGGTLAVVFAFVQAAVAALIVRAVHRIGGHVLADRWLWAICIAAGLAQLAGIHFGFTLAAGGIAYVLARQGWPRVAGALIAVATIAIGAWAWRHGLDIAAASAAAQQGPAGAQRSLAELFFSGLKAGSLTFGGAYTAIPFLQQDAVVDGAWMSNAQFLDGLALGSLLPAPLIIFATFVGYLGGGAAGAIALTVGTFLPAFAITLLAHDPLERIVSQPKAREFLEGVTAAVVGLIAATTITVLKLTLVSVPTVAVFALALFALYRVKSRLIIPLVVAAAALAGWAIALLSS